MMSEYMVLYSGGEGEITEKKSRFIATLYPVNSEESALGFIEQTRKKYRDASHHCYAYVIGRNQELQRCCDDGEPTGTAGRPMLDILLKEGLHDTLAIATRYFGGILLGTGGLVRAYQSAAKAALEHSTPIVKILGSNLRIHTNYNDIGKLQYILGQMELTPQKTEYTDAVIMHLILPKSKLNEFTKKWTAITNGRADITNISDVYFSNINGEVVIFP